MGKIGRPRTYEKDGLRVHWKNKFEISDTIAKKWRRSFIEQVTRCKSNSARRLLLGISK